MDYRELSPALVATLCVGLREDSRVKMYISGQNVPLDRILLMKAVDDLAFLCWSKTKDAPKNRNRPESVLKKALKVDKKGEDHVIFGSVDAFEEAWKKITGG